VFTINNYEYFKLCPTSNNPFQTTVGKKLPILDTGLSKSGICQKIARSVVFAPNIHMGLEVKHPFTQGIFKILNFFNTSQPTTLELTRATWYQMKNECGLGCNFLKDNEMRMQQIVTPGWLLTVWEFFNRIQDQTQKFFFNGKTTKVSTGFIYSARLMQIQMDKKHIEAM
jgi:hypothetical protein